MTSLIRSGVGRIAARANCGRWIADCPYCPNAVQPPFGTSAFDCSVCGATTEIVWPSQQMREGVERLLMMRRNPFYRSWEQGETLEDLLWENGMLGVFDGAESSGPPQIAFSVDGDNIITDQLPELVNSSVKAVDR